MKKKQPIEVLKRQAFGKLVFLLYRLKATEYIHIPVMSNVYHLEKAYNIIPPKF